MSPVTVQQRWALSTLFNILAGRVVPVDRFDGCGFRAGTCDCTTRCKVYTP